MAFLNFAEERERWVSVEGRLDDDIVVPVPLPPGQRRRAVPVSIFSHGGEGCRRTDNDDSFSTTQSIDSVYESEGYAVHEAADRTLWHRTATTSMNGEVPPPFECRTRLGCPGCPYKRKLERSFVMHLSYWRVLSRKHYRRPRDSPG